MEKFLLQCDEGGRMWELPNAVREAIEAENEWRAPDPEYKAIAYEPATLEQVREGFCEIAGAVPVGSVEFVYAVLARLGKGPLRALNVPAELRDVRFLGRQVWDAELREDVEHLLKESGKRLLVKPGDTPKRFNAMAVSPGEQAALRLISGPLFVSDILKEKIIAEWRVFFRRRRIIAARPYVLSSWVCPDRALVEEMLKVWTKAPSAGTLDVAVMENGRTVLLETHQFLACGLYGLDGPDLVPMSRDAWYWETSGRPPVSNG